MTEHTTTLKRTLGSFRLWGIAVGLVISGEYFGWSYGWSQAGTMGFMVVALAVAAMYCAFIFSFTELTTAIPHAGGPFAYAYRAFGPTGGFIAGFATLIEFVFAPPAIAMAIGAYLNVQFPALDPKWVACGAYVIFMTLNILGVGIAATFELIVTLLAIFELLVFMGVVAPGFSWSHFTANGWAGAESFSGLALPGMFAAIPFAIWFFLAIEGASMAAEEAKDPQRTIPRALGGGILTLTVLAIGVMVFAGGVGDWRALSNINDPLPQAMKTVVGNGSGWLHMLVWLGCLASSPPSTASLWATRGRSTPSPAPAICRRAGLPQPPHPHPASGDPRRRRGGYRRDLLRLADHHQRHAVDRLHRHHVGIWGYCYVYHFHGGAVQTAP